MSIQASNLARSVFTPSAIASRMNEIVGHQFDVRRFVENFDVLVNVPGSAKHLKEMVLQLAVRGGLSSPLGETADSLVSDLQRARISLAKTGVRVASVSRPVADDEEPYPLPSGWRWIRLSDLGGFLGGGTPAKSNSAFWDGPLPWVSPKDMKRPYLDDAEDHISVAAVEGSAVKIIPKQSILYVVRGMILAHSFPVAVTRRDVTINQDMKALVPALPGLSDFILRSCQAARRRVLEKVERSSHGTCRLEAEAVEMLPVALPPIAEQKRILAKVDQLMALCDDMDAQQHRKRELRTRLTKSALEGLTTATAPKEFETAWKKVVEHFEILFSQSPSVVALRDLILELAFRGSLVAEISRDIPASLRRERVEAAWVTRKRKEILSEVGVDERPTSPQRWEWVRLGNLAEIVGGVTKGRDLKGRRVHSYPYLRVANVQRGHLDLTTMKEIDIPEEELGKYQLVAGDLLFTEGGDWDKLGRSAVWRGEINLCIHQNHVFRARLLGDLDPVWFSLFANSPVGRAYFENAAKQTTNLASINMTQLRNCPMPIPPLDEQKSIVAKVALLMGVCDGLESALSRAESSAAALVEAATQDLVA